MQPHPIPQNVTTFQFHLVGDMTLKQFIYLAAGSGIAYLIFVFFATDYPYFSFPIIFISAGLGVAFAFLPIQSRPLDYWTLAFLKAIYSPTKRVWKKNNKLYFQESTFSSRLLTYLTSMQILPNQIKSTQTQSASNPPVPTIKPSITPSITPIVHAKPLTHEQLQKTVELARQAQNLQMKIIQTERTLNQIKSSGQNQAQIPITYTQQANAVLADLQNLIAQASQIKQQLESIHKASQIQPLHPNILKPKVKVIIPEKSKQTQVALTSFPNVINGIIKNAAGDYIDGVIVVIYDKEGLPVRALKTNKLGQFTGSTPLSNGTYTLEIEKEGLSFDVLQIELTGQILPPLLITGKQAAIS